MKYVKCSFVLSCDKKISADIESFTPASVELSNHSHELGHGQTTVTVLGQPVPYVVHTSSRMA